MKSQSIIILAFIALVCLASVTEASVRRRKLKVTSAPAGDVKPSDELVAFCVSDCDGTCKDKLEAGDVKNCDNHDDVHACTDRECVWADGKCV